MLVDILREKMIYVQTLFWFPLKISKTIYQCYVSRRNITDTTHKIQLIHVFELYKKSV